MAKVQIAVNNSHCYQLLPNGSIKVFEEGSDPARWTTIDRNADNAQIIAADTVCVRRKNGEIHRYDGKAWKLIGTNATNLWGSGSHYWQWRKDGNGSRLLEYDGNASTWKEVDTNTSTTSVAFFSSQLWQLRADGNIYIGKGSSWEVFNSSPQKTTELVTGGDALHQLRKNGQIYSWNGSGWTLIGSDMRTVQITAGEAGLYQLQKDGSIYHHLSSKSWDLVDSSPENVYVAAAKWPYRVTANGAIYRLVDNSGVWKKLQNSTEEQMAIDDSNKGAVCTGGVEAESVYDGGFSSSSDVLIRIGNGAAGQSGLVKALSDAFIQSCVQSGQKPFKMAWYKSDTTESIRYLKEGVTDIAITYTPAAEKIAMNQGIALKQSYSIFHEHLMLVGPPSNPAKLNLRSDVEEMFSALYTAAEAGNTKPVVRFLSRYDKSATNCKESEMWVKIGQVPWASKYSNWYHQYIAYPIQALTAAAVLEEYTLTDWGTYLSVDAAIENKVLIYKKGSEDAKDPLLLPAHLLIGSHAKDGALAKKFADWAVSPAGQAIVTGFKKKGQFLYTSGV